jgi:type IV secretory pathway VirB2 component (pilin)
MRRAWRKAASCFWLALVGILLASVSTAASAQTGGSATTLQQRLNSLKQQLSQAFAVTTFSADRQNIVTPGATLILQKNGFLMYSVTAPLPAANTYEHGKIGSSRVEKAVQVSESVIDRFHHNETDYPRRTYTAGDKIWVSQIVVEPNGASFLLYSDLDGNNNRYYGELKFPFGKGYVPAPDEALNTIAEVLTVQPANNSNSTGSRQSSSQGQGTPEESFSPIAPPPPPTDEQRPQSSSATTHPPTSAPPDQPPNISIGDTKDQVIAAFGQPQRIVKLQTKEIDYYQDMKVNYVNGKVTDVQ